MHGRIKVGVWLPFAAVQTVDGRSFTWQARVGRRPLRPLRVTDRYADAIGRTEGRLLGHLTLFGAEDFDTARSAATRTAIESVVFAPPSVLPDRGVVWQAETEHVIVARFDLPPEHPEVRLTHRRPRRAANRQRPALGQRRREDLPVHPVRGRAPRRAPLRRPRPSQQRERRLVVQHPALRAVLQRAHQRRQPPVTRALPDPRRERCAPDRSRLFQSIRPPHRTCSDKPRGRLRETRSGRVRSPDARRGRAGRTVRSAMTRRTPSRSPAPRPRRRRWRRGDRGRPGSARARRRSRQHRAARPRRGLRGPAFVGPLAVQRGRRHRGCRWTGSRKLGIARHRGALAAVDVQAPRGPHHGRRAPRL